MLRVELITTRQLVKASGATYRQIDYWTRQAIIPCFSGAMPGSGHTRHYEDDGDLIKKVKLLVTVSKAFFGNPHVDILKKIFDNYKDGWLMLSDTVELHWEIE